MANNELFDLSSEIMIKRNRSAATHLPMYRVNKNFDNLSFQLFMFNLGMDPNTISICESAIIVDQLLDSLGRNSEPLCSLITARAIALALSDLVNTEVGTGRCSTDKGAFSSPSSAGIPIAKLRMSSPTSLTRRERTAGRTRHRQKPELF